MVPYGYTRDSDYYGRLDDKWQGFETEDAYREILKEKSEEEED